jgi:hypothetical protein
MQVSGNANIIYAINHSLEFLNPFANPTGASLNHSYLSSFTTGEYLGHDISNVATTGQPPESPYDRYDEYRPLALKGPLVLTAWGYDTDGKPVPNAGVSTDYFQDKWLQKPETWATGPVDLRWDHKRQVWTCQPPYKPMWGQVTSGLANDVYLIEVTSQYNLLYRNAHGISPYFRDTDGAAIDTCTITGISPSFNKYKSGDYVLAEYVPDEELFLITQDNIGVKFCTTDEPLVYNSSGTATLEGGGSIVVYDRVLADGVQIKSGTDLQVVRSDNDGLWYPIWQATEWNHPWRILADTTQYVNTGDASFTVGNVQEISPYCIEFVNGNEPSTITNSMHFEFDNGVTIVAEYRPSSNSFDVIQGPCP